MFARGHDPGGAQVSSADTVARAAEWMDAAARRCAEGASRGGAGAGEGEGEQGRAGRGEGGKGRGYGPPERCLCSFLGFAERLVTVSASTRVGGP